MLNNVCFIRCVDAAENAFISICLKRRYFVYINTVQCVKCSILYIGGPNVQARRGAPNHLAPALTNVDTSWASKAKHSSCHNWHAANEISRVVIFSMYIGKKKTILRPFYPTNYWIYNLSRQLQYYRKSQTLSIQQMPHKRSLRYKNKRSTPQIFPATLKTCIYIKGINTMPLDVVKTYIPRCNPIFLFECLSYITNAVVMLDAAHYVNGISSWSRFYSVSFI